jgi:hypothetical protein
LLVSRKFTIAMAMMMRNRSQAMAEARPKDFCAPQPTS